jgi:DUF4097 and DUF4098 domain-containing protein YvlB
MPNSRFAAISAGISFGRFLIFTATCLSGLFIFSSPAEAKETRYKDYPIEIHDGDRIVITGLRASVKLQQSASAKNAVVRVRKSVSDKAAPEDQAKFDVLSFSVRREGQAIIVEAKGPESKAAFSQWLKPSAPELVVEIDAPAVPVEILAHDGQVLISNFHQSVAVNLVSGGIKTNGTDGLLRLELQNGQLNIDKHHGRLEIDSYGGKLAIQDLDGDLDLANFSGDSTITRSKGNIDLKSHSGPVTIAKSSGSVDFLSGRGVFTMSGFEGPVRGQTDQGPVSIGVEGDADVHVESNQGPVTVKLPADSGALVRMQTEEGTMSPPDAIKATGAGRSKLISGRLPGEGSGGTVAVKSKSGALRVRL